MQAMNAPGLTLGLTDATTTRRVACYGYANLDLRTPVNAGHLFQIGSITKSFVALVILQLRDENKIDLHKPVLDYLPELPIVTELGPVTAHHLLTHTSGLPDDMFLFQADPTARLVQGFAPGEHFHYCNPAFVILGLLAEKLDGRPWRILLQERILRPLGMTQTSPVISPAIRAATAASYDPFRDDLVYPRQGRLAPAPNLVTDETDGCIASTPGDMARYARMLLTRGQGPASRIVSEESFALMTTPYIKAPDFSPTASYGYGVAVDTLDGHRILRHTGGMISFASSIHVDLDGGVAAFASINAMQGYRPVDVTQYAVRLLRAERETKPLPPPPPLTDPCVAENAADYAGTFTATDGRKLVFTVNEKRVSVMENDKTVLLQHNGGDHFISTVPGILGEHTLVFGRKPAPTGASPSAPQPVVEVAYGPDWYAGENWDGPHTFAVPAEYALYAGRYQSDNVWSGAALVYILNGRLMADGEPLTPLGRHLFHVGSENWLPETMEFLHIVEGKARVMRAGGLDYRRVDVG